VVVKERIGASWAAIWSINFGFLWDSFRSTSAAKSRSSNLYAFHSQRCKRCATQNPKPNPKSKPKSKSKITTQDRGPKSELLPIGG
jgi:hypothetical protein